MKYDCTLLKDLPNCNAGTTFKIEKDDETGKIAYLDFDSIRRIPLDIIDNPIWVEQTLDESCLTELKCKGCGSTKMSLKAVHVPYDYDDGVYFYRMKLVGTCTCGHKTDFLTFTTHTRVTY